MISSFLGRISIHSGSSLMRISFKNSPKVPQSFRLAWMDRLSVKFAPSHSSWNYTKLDPRSLGTVEFLCKTAHVLEYPGCNLALLHFCCSRIPLFFRRKVARKKKEKLHVAAAKIQRPGLVPFLSTKESKPLWMADNSCGYDSLRAACLRWMRNGKAQSHQWSLDILLYCCTRFRKQVKTRWQRMRSTLSIFHVQCFSSKPHDLAAAWMIGPGEATRTGSTSPLCGVTRLAEIWRIFAASFHLHFLCKARYDRLMRSAIVIQSGGIMGIRKTCQRDEDWE